MTRHGSGERGDQIREAVDADWEEAGRICYEAFATLADQHGFPHDFPTVEAASAPIRWLINHPQVYGVVAEKDGRVLGSQLPRRARHHLRRSARSAWIPRAQDHHVGRMLMEAMLERAHARDAPGRPAASRSRTTTGR